MSNRTHHICLVDDKGNIESIITLGKDTELETNLKAHQVKKDID